MLAEDPSEILNLRLPTGGRGASKHDGRPTDALPWATKTFTGWIHTESPSMAYLVPVTSTSDKGRKAPLQWRDLVDTTLTRRSRSASPILGQNDWAPPAGREGHSITAVTGPSRRASFEPNSEETPDKLWVTRSKT